MSSHNATTTTPSRNSIGLPSDTSLRKTDEQLRKLNEEIDAVAAKIDAEKAEWKKANTKYKPVYQKSIDTLYEALKDLRATRAKLIEAGIAAPVPVPVPVFFFSTDGRVFIRDFERIITRPELGRHHEQSSRNC